MSIYPAEPAAGLDAIEYAVAGGDTQSLIGTSGANISSIEARSPRRRQGRRAAVQAGDRHD